MAIVYPLTFPTIKQASAITWGGRSAVAVSVSVFSFVQQSQRHQGQMWFGTVTFPPMERADAAEFQAFLASLNGREGTFNYGDPAAKTARGVATGTPLANTVGSPSTNLKRGQEFITDGWTASQTGILKAGDYLQVGSGSGAHLHMNLTDQNSDGSGNATFDLWPRLRENVANNAVIVVASPVGLFRLVSSEWSWTEQPGPLWSLAFDIAEAL